MCVGVGGWVWCTFELGAIDGDEHATAVAYAVSEAAAVDAAIARSVLAAAVQPVVDKLALQLLPATAREEIRPLAAKGSEPPVALVAARRQGQTNPPPPRPPPPARAHSRRIIRL